MKNVMIDLETLGTGYRAAIASIGAVEFDYKTGEIGQEFHRRISLESAVGQGLNMDPSTVLWWMKQSEEAKQELFGEELISTALDDLASWLPKKAKVWSNGSNFDLRILREAYEVFGPCCPWHFRDERDMRTFSALMPRVTLVRGGTHHNALDDAIFQAHLMSKAWAEQRQVKNHGQ